MDLHPTIAPMSPDFIYSKICISSALTLIKDCILSISPVFEFLIFCLFFSMPE